MSPWATYEHGAWVVPDAPGRLPQPGSASGLQLLLSNIAPWLLQRSSGSGGGSKRPRPAPIVALSVGSALGVYVIAVLIGYASLRRGV